MVMRLHRGAVGRSCLWTKSSEWNSLASGVRSMPRSPRTKLITSILWPGGTSRVGRLQST